MNKNQKITKYQNKASLLLLLAGLFFLGTANIWTYRITPSLWGDWAIFDGTLDLISIVVIIFTFSVLMAKAVCIFTDTTLFSDTVLPNIKLKWLYIVTLIGLTYGTVTISELNDTNRRVPWQEYVHELSPMIVLVLLIGAMIYIRKIKSIEESKDECENEE